MTCDDTKSKVDNRKDYNIVVSHSDDVFQYDNRNFLLFVSGGSTISFIQQILSTMRTISTLHFT